MERNVGRRKGILFTAASAVLFGITPVFSKQALLAGISSQMLALYSNGLACLTIGGCMKAKCISFRVKKMQLFHLLWIGCIGQAGTNLLLYRAYIHIPVGMATLIHFLYPLLVYGELILFFGERLEPGKLVGLFAAMAGLAMFLEKGGISGSGIVCAILSAVTFSVYMVGMDKAGLKELPYMTVAFYAMLFSSLFLFLCNLAGGRLTGEMTPRVLFWAVLCAMGGNVLGKILLQRGIGLVGAGLAAVLSLFEPITSLLLGVVIDQDSWSLRKTIGCALILGAVRVISAEKPGKEESRL